ncbi:MAG: sigma 54-interacting transcriptional regulator, partial [Terriglobia bacterium]
MPAEVETVATDRYEALLRVSQTLNSNRCPQTLLSVLARELRGVIEFYYLGVGIYDEGAHQIRFTKFNEWGAPIEPPELAPEETLTWWVYQHQEPLIIPFVEKETRFPASIERLKKHGINSMCNLPLTTVHRRLGSLAVGSKEPAAYSDEAVFFLSLVASHVAQALDNAMNFEAAERAKEELSRKHAESQKERDQLQLLLDITNKVVSNLDLRELLRAFSANVRRVMACDGAGVLLPDSDGKQLRVYAIDFPDCNVKEDRLIPIDDSPMGRAFQTMEPLVNVEPELPQAGSQSNVSGCGKTSCFIPLVSRNRSVGVLAFAKMGKGSFSQDDIGFLSQVAAQVAIAVENANAYRQIEELKDQLAQEKVYLEDEIRSELHFEEMIGESPALRRILGQVETVAPTDSSVLIYGETGTGKELIARAIHNLSERKSNAFVKLNCAAIPTGLMESELFGHERGAFTGAISQRVGRFELAHRGTIFLDEVGEIPLELQPKLLRVLQEREFERLGSTRTLRTDARVIAATNRDLATVVEEQKFRADLFYRLNVFPIQAPALRERPEDIPLLVRHFVQQFSHRMNKTIRSISTETMRSLSDYNWPGNV